MANANGVIAVFNNEHDLLKVARAAREQKNFKNYDTFSPYPVHGMDDAMGLKRSWLPYVTFIGGSVGLAIAVGLQVWTSAFDWPINIGGKPLISFPAFVPIMFELTVLIGGLSTVAALVAACVLRKHKTGILHPGITNDKFVIFVPSTEHNYNEGDVKSFLQGFQPEEVTSVTE